jgi:hypothetical protein
MPGRGAAGDAARGEAGAAAGEAAGVTPTWIQWTAVLGPPVVWAARFGAGYALVPHACTADALWLLHALTAGGLVSCAVLGLVSHRLARRLGEEDSAVAGTALARSAFMARLGILSSLLFGTVILAEGLANVFLDPCQTSGPLLP